MTFLIPFFLALMVGAIGITRQAWRDEHATWRAATIPMPDLTDLLSRMDIVLAPYYVFMRAWIFVFGDSVVAMRLPSLLAMAAAAGLTGLVGARLYDPWVGVVAGALLAVVPSISRYAEEARPYSFAICFAVASILALVSRRWILLGVTVALTGLGHLIALIVLLAHLPLVLGGIRPVWRKWVVAVGVGLVPVVPLVVLGVRQTDQVSWINSSWKNAATLPMSLTRSAVVAGILAALAILGVLASRFDRRLATLLVWALAPPAAVFLLAPQFFFYRYLLFTLPAWTLLAALGASSAVGASSAARALSRKRQTVAAIALCAAVLVLGARDHKGVRSSPLAGDQDYQGAAAYVGDHMREGDSVLFNGYPDQRERFGFAYELRARPSPARCEHLTTCADRVWLVTNQAAAPMPAGFVVLDEKTFPGIGLRLLLRG